ncbi:MAG: SHOCT domain-containing protein [Paracoccaceae bacterium]
MAAQYQLNNGSFLYHFCILLVLAALGFYWVVGTFTGEITAENNPVFNIVGALSLLVAFFYPVGLVGDVSDKIPTIAEHNKTAKKNGLKKVKVSHPKTTLVWVLFIAGLFTFGILWIFALIVATGTHNVTITDDIAIDMGMKEVGRQDASTNAQELLSLKKLLDEGILTQEQFDKKKAEMGF